MKQLPQRIYIQLHSSRRLALFVAATHLLTLSVITLLPPDGLLRAPLTLAVLFGFHRAWKQWVRLDGRSAVTGLELAPTGEWTLFNPRGALTPARLLGNSFVSPSLTLLNFSLGRMRRRKVILLTDNADPDQVRRLRVRLLIERKSD